MAATLMASTTSLLFIPSVSAIDSAMPSIISNGEDGELDGSDEVDDSVIISADGGG